MLVSSWVSPLLEFLLSVIPLDITHSSKANFKCCSRQPTFATEMLHCSRKKAESCYTTESSKLISTLGTKQFPYRLSVSWDAGENDPLSLQGTPEYTLTVTTHIKNLLQCCVSMQAGSEVGSLMWLWASQFISLQPIIPAQVIVKVTGLFSFPNP